MTKEELEFKAGNIALSNFLSNYPDDMCYDDIIDLLLTESEDAVLEHDISIWEPFERHSNFDIARYIEDLRATVVYYFREECDETAQLCSQVRTA